MGLIVMVTQLREKISDLRSEIFALETKLDASVTWNKCIESAFAKEIARVNNAMLRAMDERDELRRETEKQKKENEKQVGKLIQENKKLIDKLREANAKLGNVETNTPT